MRSCYNIDFHLEVVHCKIIWYQSIVCQPGLHSTTRSTRKTNPLNRKCDYKAPILQKVNLCQLSIAFCSLPESIGRNQKILAILAPGFLSTNSFCWDYWWCPLCPNWFNIEDGTQHDDFQNKYLFCRSVHADWLLKFALDDKTDMIRESEIELWVKTSPRLQDPLHMKSFRFQQNHCFESLLKVQSNQNCQNKSRNKCLQKELKQLLFTHHLLDLSNVTCSTG